MDGVFSVSDLWECFVTLFHLPGDYCVVLCVEHWAGGRDFFELSCSSVGGTFSTVVALVFWMGLFGIAAD